ncbi:hypothetical protein P8452_76366 [Trifolium repens]|nr:hypothetical protein P8452_76366 [Trifolium repens]
MMFCIYSVNKSMRLVDLKPVVLCLDNLPSVLFAMAGGVVLSIGNLSSQYVWAFVGLSVAGVITSSIIVVIGTSLNYFLVDKMNKAEILFPGVGCFFVSTLIGEIETLLQN